MITWQTASELPSVPEWAEQARTTVLSRMRGLVQEMQTEIDQRGLPPAQRAPLDRHVARAQALVQALPGRLRPREWQTWREKSPRELLEKLLQEG